MTSPGFSRRRFLACAAAACASAPPALHAGPPEPPVWRLAPEGWGKASAADVTAVLNSAIMPLWRHFPGRKLEPMVVIRGRNGPITHFQRNSMREIVVQLDTSDFYWCQYAYQMAHEFCHVLCGFDDDWKGNLWFEESLCETASLFVLRRMAESWAKQPPYESWRSFAPKFREYADDIMDRRVSVPDSKLPAFYQRHGKELAQNPVDRELNGTISLNLLRLLEASPHFWEAVTWLNSKPSPPGETFRDYLLKWKQATPERCHGMIFETARRFGIQLHGSAD